MRSYEDPHRDEGHSARAPAPGGAPTVAGTPTAVKLRTTGRPATVAIMGVLLDNLSEEEVIDHIISAACEGVGGWVVNPNVDVLRQVVAEPALRRLVQGADLALADGMPLLWAASLQGGSLKARVPVSEMINGLCAEAARRGVPAFFLGGAPGTALRASQVLAGSHKGLVVGHLCPPMGFEHNKSALEAIFEALSAASPGVVFCAFGFPKQERLMSALHERFPSMWFIGSGGTFSMVAGDTPQAPSWMRKSGLEWAHRLRLEPGRLFKRYIVQDIPFAVRLLVSSSLVRLRRGPPTPPVVALDRVDLARVDLEWAELGKEARR